MTTVSNSKPAPQHLDSLVLLRSIAVIMVCCCHFGFPLVGNNSFSGLFKIFEKYGLYGVQVFFVISGFIIPFSLFRGKYTLRNYPQFLYKRVLRLHPPYLAALALTLIIMYLSYGARHVPFPENATSILKSIVYLHIPPDNPVFWTLIVEAQYYVFIGLFYVLLMKSPKLAYFVAMPALLFLCHITAGSTLLIAPFLAYFFLGNIGYMIYTNNGEKNVNLIALAGIIAFIAFSYEIAALLFSVGTVLFILLFKKRVTGLPVFIGNISYSIYLIHFPIGVKLVNLIKTKINPEYNWLLFMGTLVLIVGLAWVFYKVVEEFSERLSKKVKYRSVPTPAATPGVLV